LKIQDSAWSEAARLQRSIIESEGNGEAEKTERRLLTGLLYESARHSMNEGRLTECGSRRIHGEQDEEGEARSLRWRRPRALPHEARCVHLGTEGLHEKA